MLFVSQEERRASETVLFTSENNDIANQGVDTSFFTSEKNRMTNQLASLARRDYFYLDAFWSVNLGMYIKMNFILINLIPMRKDFYICLQIFTIFSIGNFIFYLIST